MSARRPASKPAFSSEVIFTGDVPAATLSARTERGELRRLRVGVYTTNLGEPLERITRRNRYAIISRLLPGAVVTDRSALPGFTSSEVLFVCHEGSTRDIQLPGLLIRARHGYGPIAGDSQLGAFAVFQASRQRALVENMRPSRSRGGRPSRTASIAEIEDVVTAIAQAEGREGLERLRVDVLAAGEALFERNAATAVVAVVDALLGSSPAYRPTSPRLTAHLRGAPFDPFALARFDLLIDELVRLPPAKSTTRPLGELPFFDAYFSNFIEGTEFAVDDARRIVMDGWEPVGRPEDAHDVRCTYTVVADDDEMRRVAGDADEFLALLRERHRILLASRPDKHPGRFKRLDNRAGGTVFVAHELVEGTIREGFRRLESLVDPFQRAVFVMFLVAEVHPFDDGNGRLARVVMNTELAAAGHQRIVIPSVYREDYLGALRALSRSDNPVPLHRMLAFAQDVCRRVDWSDYAAAQATLEANNAFLSPEEADRLGRRLTLP